MTEYAVRISLETFSRKNENVLAEQISYARNHAASGFMFFRYDTFVDKANYIFP